MLGLVVSLNLEVSDAFIPQNPALAPGSLPGPTPGLRDTPQDSRSACILRLRLRLRTGARHLGETQLRAALVLWPPSSGHTRARPGGQLATGSWGSSVMGGHGSSG